MKEIYIHLGAHRNASTSIQYALTHAIKKKPSEVEYLCPQTASRKSDPIKSLCLASTQRQSKESLEELSLNVLNYFNNSDKTKFFLSEENILGKMLGLTTEFYPYLKQVNYIIDKLKQHFKVKALLVVRDPSDFIISCYAFRAASQSILPPSQFLETLNLKSISWCRVIEELRLTYGNNLHLVPFELMKSDIDTFMTSLRHFSDLFNEITTLPRVNNSKGDFIVYVLQQSRIRAYKKVALIKEEVRLSNKITSLIQAELMRITKEEKTSAQLISSHLSEIITSIVKVLDKYWEKQIKNTRPVIAHIVKNYCEITIKSNLSPNSFSSIEKGYLADYFKNDTERLFGLYMKEEWRKLWK